MKIRELLLPLVVGGALLLGGCVDLTVGKPIDGQKIELIEPGRTTVTEINDWFGPPLRQHSTATGKIFVYRYITEAVCHELVVSFSEDESVMVFSKQGL